MQCTCTASHSSQQQKLITAFPGQDAALAHLETVPAGAPCARPRWACPCGAAPPAGPRIAPRPPDSRCPACQSAQWPPLTAPQGCRLQRAEVEGSVPPELRPTAASATATMTLSCLCTSGTDTRAASGKHTVALAGQQQPLKGVQAQNADIATSRKAQPQTNAQTAPACTRHVHICCRDTAAELLQSSCTGGGSPGVPSFAVTTHMLSFSSADVPLVPHTSAAKVWGGVVSAPTESLYCLNQSMAAAASSSRPCWVAASCSGQAASDSQGKSAWTMTEGLQAAWHALGRSANCCLLCAVPPLSKGHGSACPRSANCYYLCALPPSARDMAVDVGRMPMHCRRQAMSPAAAIYCFLRGACLRHICSP